VFTAGGVSGYCHGVWLKDAQSRHAAAHAPGCVTHARGCHGRGEGVRAATAGHTARRHLDAPAMQQAAFVTRLSAPWFVSWRFMTFKLALCEPPAPLWLVNTWWGVVWYECYDDGPACVTLLCCMYPVPVFAAVLARRRVVVPCADRKPGPPHTNSKVSVRTAWHGAASSIAGHAFRHMQRSIVLSISTHAGKYLESRLSTQQMTMSLDAVPVCGPV